MRSGAPDKIMLQTNPCYKMVKHDNTNLVDYSFKELKELLADGSMILPADEADILHANKLFNQGLTDQDGILLPQRFKSTGSGTIPTLAVIDYKEFVPKNSKFYKELDGKTSAKYAKFTEYSTADFGELFLDEINAMGRIAIKTTTGSGSRGVILIDPERVHLGGKYVPALTHSVWKEFMKFAESEYERTDGETRIIIQDLIPSNLLKVNVDFIIKHGKLLGYRWDEVNQSQQFTNWDNGTVVRNGYTDDVVCDIVCYLVDECGIENAIMNFEAFSDETSETWIVEFNWRYSNSMFTFEAFGIDPIWNYINDQSFEIPYGRHKFARYWRAMLYENIPGYHVGK